MKTLLIKPLTIVAFLLFLTTGNLSAQNYYASPTGFLTWEESSNIATPYSSFTAMENAVAIDAVYFRSGTSELFYYKTIAPPDYSYKGILNPSNFGMPNNPNTFMANPNEISISNGHTYSEIPDAATALGTNDVNSIIFEENFDNHPDWEVLDSSEACNNLGSCDGSIPENWTYLRNTESWHPMEGYVGNQPSQSINSNHARGGSGKSWVRYHESSKDNTSTFGDDTLLLKDLGDDYDDLYMRFWIKFDPNWQWVEGSSKFKLARFFHFDGPDGVANPWNYFSDGDSSPIFIFDVKQSSTWGFRSTYSGRCDPQETDYYCNPSREWEGDALWAGAPTFEESMGDSQWHQLELRVKMNSALAVPDGVFTVWLDSVEQYSFTDVPWRENGSSENIGWNMIGIGGNTTNWFAPVIDQAEQWYTIDDLVVYTPIDVSSPYWESSPEDGRLPSDYVVGNGTLSINEDTFNDVITLIPNPTSDTFKINLKDEVLEKVIIYNQLGQQIRETTTKEVNISNLSNGIYFVKITTQSGKTATKKIIKN